MTTTTGNALQRAIDCLGAIEVAPKLYARYDPQDARWCVGTIDIDGSWGYKRWLPAWWTPEQRVAMKCARCGAISLDLQRAPSGHDHGLKSAIFERVTVDYETGEEVTA